MEKEEALMICRDVVKKDKVMTIIPIPVATLLLDLEKRVNQLESNELREKMEKLE